jgi:type I restriction enzyme R subunit
MMTSFWHPDGTPMSAHQFLEMLFGRLPEFFNLKTAVVSRSRG